MTSLPHPLSSSTSTKEETRVGRKRQRDENTLLSSSRTTRSRSRQEELPRNSVRARRPTDRRSREEDSLTVTEFSRRHVQRRQPHEDFREPRRERRQGNDDGTTVGVGFRFVGFPSVEGIIFSRNGDIPDPSDILNQILHSELGGILNQLLQQTDAMQHGTPPAAVSDVESLPVLTIREDESEKQCAVCICDFTTGEQAKQMPCKHIFHPDCIHPWLAKHNSCPTCRQEMRTDDVVYERRKERHRV